MRRVCVCVCVCVGVCVYVLVLHEYAPVYNLSDILYLYYGFLPSNLFMIVVNVSVLAFLLHLFKLVSFILVKLNCPVRDD